MYLNKYNNFYHGIMFHHFHDNKLHKFGQGSINKDEFYKIIKYVGVKNILDAGDFFDRVLNNKIKKNDICLTFDDGIKCQYDIALPVLEDLNIKAFFFVYSSMFTKNPDLLEVYRYFRLNYYENVDLFYFDFFKKISQNLEAFYKKNNTLIKNYKRKFPHYSNNDIKYRLVRDRYLNKIQYENILNEMFHEKNFKKEKYYTKLFFSRKNLIDIFKKGHLVGLHSHTHPTLIENFSKEKQINEYKTNKQLLENILNINSNDIKFMSHPCGSYNYLSLEVLKELNIKLGFKQIMKIEKNKNMRKINNSHLEIAREDHVNILKRIIL